MNPNCLYAKRGVESFITYLLTSSLVTESFFLSFSLFLFLPLLDLCIRVSTLCTFRHQLLFSFPLSSSGSTFLNEKESERETSFQPLDIPVPLVFEREL